MGPGSAMHRCAMHRVRDTMLSKIGGIILYMPRPPATHCLKLLRLDASELGEIGP